MKSGVIVFIAGIICLGATGCASLNSVQKAELEAMKASDANVYVEEKSTGTATALGFLPGCGSFYTRQAGLGVLDLLLWPVSICWDPSAGYQGAKAINYSVSKARAKKMMEQEMRELDEKLDEKLITDQQYRRDTKRITDRYKFD